MLPWRGFRTLGGPAGVCHWLRALGRFRLEISGWAGCPPCSLQSRWLVVSLGVLGPGHYSRRRYLPPLRGRGWFRYLFHRPPRACPCRTRVVRLCHRTSLGIHGVIHGQRSACLSGFFLAWRWLVGIVVLVSWEVFVDVSCMLGIRPCQHFPSPLALSRFSFSWGTFSPSWLLD